MIPTRRESQESELAARPLVVEPAFDDYLFTGRFLMLDISVCPSPRTLGRA
jgi:hypothetical protein